MVPFEREADSAIEGTGIAVIVDERLAYSPPTLAESSAYAESRSTAIEQYQRATYDYEEKKKIEMQEKHRDKIELKRKLKLEKRQQQLELAEQEGFKVFVPDIEPGEETTGPPAPSQPSVSTPDLSSIPYTILIDTTSSSYPWYDPSSTASPPSVHSTLESAAEAKVWNYPGNPQQQSRCLVFEDLWRKGFYMGGGLRFGGDFLVYPGEHNRAPPSFGTPAVDSSDDCDR